MEVAAVDVEFRDGAFHVAGTDKAMAMTEVAKAFYYPMGITDKFGVGLEASGTFATEPPNHPNGCHVCEVEIDPETGTARVERYAVVDDVGTVVNPKTLKGQIHGGIAQGLGQVLMEEVVYDPGSGQLLGASLMDYALPRADDLCAIEVATRPVPTRLNPLGAKGAGEAGTVGALPAVMNAIRDALAPLGVTALAMPATSERIWRAIAAARHAGG